MPYKLYIDKNENFECEVDVKNASLIGAFARLVVESDNLSFVFNGKIQDGKCIIPIRKMKGLLSENSKGNMHLEVVVEDTYFKPWQSDYVVEEHTSVKVKVNEQKEISNKPIVEVKVPSETKKESSKKVIEENKSVNTQVPLREISSLCTMFGINKKNIRERKTEFTQIMREYFNANPEYNNHKSTILRGIAGFLK